MVGERDLYLVPAGQQSLDHERRGGRIVIEGLRGAGELAVQRYAGPRGDRRDLDRGARPLQRKADAFRPICPDADLLLSTRVPAPRRADDVIPRQDGNDVACLFGQRPSVDEDLGVGGTDADAQERDQALPASVEPRQEIVVRFGDRKVVCRIETDQAIEIGVDAVATIICPARLRSQLERSLQEQAQRFRRVAIDALGAAEEPIESVQSAVDVARCEERVGAGQQKPQHLGVGLLPGGAQWHEHREGDEESDSLHSITTTLRPLRSATKTRPASSTVRSRGPRSSMAPGRPGPMR